MEDRVQYLEDTLGTVQRALIAAMEEIETLRAETQDIRRECHASIDALVAQQQHDDEEDEEEDLGDDDEGGDALDKGAVETGRRDEVADDGGVQVALRHVQEQLDTVVHRADDERARREALEAALHQLQDAVESNDMQARQRLHTQAQLLDHYKAQLDAAEKKQQQRLDEAVDHMTQREQQLEQLLRPARPDPAEGPAASAGDVRAVTNRLQHLEDHVDDMHRAMKRLRELHDLLADTVQRTVQGGPAEAATASAPAECGGLDLEVLEERVRRVVEDRFHGLVQQEQRALEERKPPVEVREPHGATAADRIACHAPQHLPLPLTAGSPFELKTAQHELQVLRNDLSRCVAEIEKVMDANQRMGNSVHNCLLSSQKHEQELRGIRDGIEHTIQNEMARLQTLHTNFVARQEKYVAHEMHQLGVKSQLELQQLQERQRDEIQKAQLARVTEVHDARDHMRSELQRFTAAQQDDVQRATRSLKEEAKKHHAELTLLMEREIVRQGDALRQSQAALLNDALRLASQASDDIATVRQHVKEQSQQSQQQHQFMQERIETWLDGEMRQFQSTVSNITLTTQKKVDHEVQRLFGIYDANAFQQLQHDAQAVQEQLRRLQEEQGSLRDALHAAITPSAVLGSLDHRVAVLRQDMVTMYEQFVALRDAAGVGNAGAPPPLGLRLRPRPNEEAENANRALAPLRKPHPTPTWGADLAPLLEVQQDVADLRGRVRLMESAMVDLMGPPKAPPGGTRDGDTVPPLTAKAKLHHESDFFDDPNAAPRQTVPATGASPRRQAVGGVKTLDRARTSADAALHPAMTTRSVVEGGRPGANDRSPPGAASRRHRSPEFLRRQGATTGGNAARPLMHGGGRSPSKPPGPQEADLVAQPYALPDAMTPPRSLHGHRPVRAPLQGSAAGGAASSSGAVAAPAPAKGGGDGTTEPRSSPQRPLHQRPTLRSGTAAPATGRSLPQPRRTDPVSHPGATDAGSPGITADAYESPGGFALRHVYPEQSQPQRSRFGAEREAHDPLARLFADA